jgi:hypothetical protein
MYYYYRGFIVLTATSQLGQPTNKGNARRVGWKKKPLWRLVLVWGGGGKVRKRGKNRKFKNTWLGMRRERGKKRIREKNRKFKKTCGFANII